MRLNVKALAFALALIWAGAIFTTGLANLIWPGYGEAFLQTVGSIYPGYSGGSSFLQVLLGTALWPSGWLYWRLGPGLALQSVFR